jgi:hypothetical protein
MAGPSRKGVKPHQWNGSGGGRLFCIYCGMEQGLGAVHDPAPQSQ